MFLKYICPYVFTIKSVIKLWKIINTLIHEREEFISNSYKVQSCASICVLILLCMGVCVYFFIYISIFTYGPILIS